MFSGTNNKNEDIQNTNQTNVDNTQVGQDSGFSWLLKYSESDDTEAVSADKNKSVEQTSEAYNETKVDQVSTVQSPVSTEADYATPLERSKSDTAKVVSDDSPTERDDDTDHDTDERELDDDLKSEEKSNLIINTVLSFDSEDLNAGDINKSDAENLHKNDDTGKPEEKETDTNPESRKSSFSNDESLIGDNPDSSMPHTQTSYVSEDSSILSDHNSPKKKVFKSPFANFSKGEKVLLLCVVLSSAAFIASLISSALGKPLCPDEKGNLISLAILGTAAIILVAASLAHFHYSGKSKGESSPLSTLEGGEVVEVVKDRNMCS